MNKRNTIAAACLIGLPLAFGQAVHAQNEQTPEPKAGDILYYQNNDDKTLRVADERPEFRMWVPTKEGLRAVDVDADKMVVMTQKDGRKVLALSVAFVNQFDSLNPETGETNRDTNTKQVKRRLDSLKYESGIGIEDIRRAAKTSRRYFDLNKHFGVASKRSEIRMWVVSADGATPTSRAGDIDGYYRYDTNGDGQIDDTDSRVADGRPEFRINLSTRENGTLRAVDIDADTMIPVELKSGKTVLAPSVAFISEFDILNSEAMRGLSEAQQTMIKAAGENRSVDKKQIAFMLQHVKTAHGVEYDEIKKAAKTSERYFDLD